MKIERINNLRKYVFNKKSRTSKTILNYI